MMRRPSLLLALALIAMACPFEIAGPETSLDGLPEGLEVTLELEPDVVDQHAPFAATLRVRNTTSEPISITTTSTCLAEPYVLRDGRRIPFEGSWWGCGAAISTHVLAAGETRTRTWNMRAELFAQAEGDTDGAPAPRGTYWVHAEFGIYPPRNGGRKPSVAAMLRVM